MYQDQFYDYHYSCNLSLLALIGFAAIQIRIQILLNIKLKKINNLVAVTCFWFMMLFTQKQQNMEYTHQHSYILHQFN